MDLSNPVTERKFYPLVVVFGALLAFALLGNLNLDSLRLFCMVCCFAAFLSILFGSQKQQEALAQQIRIEEQKKLLIQVNDKIHNLRSFIVVGKKMLRSLPLPEEERVSLMCAILTIVDMTSDLHRQHKTIVEGIPAEGLEHKERAEHLAQIIKYSILLKLDETRNGRKSSIVFDLKQEHYAIFSSVNATDLRGILSNLLNNALEASANQIVLKLSSDDFNNIIQISDNGVGMPEFVLEKLKRNGKISYGKSASENQGIGIPQASAAIKKWGGHLAIESVQGKGTLLTLVLPRCEAPAWFERSLVFLDDCLIVVLSNQPVQLAIWKARLLPENYFRTERRLLLIQNVDDLGNHLQELGNQSLYFLVDFDFGKSEENVLSTLLDRFPVARFSLVTNAWDDESVQQSAVLSDVKIVPNEMLPYVPILFSRRAEFLQHKPINQAPFPSPFVLIDDNPMVKDHWMESASRFRIQLPETFSNVSEFLAVSHNISHIACIYIDSNLGDGTKGEWEAYKIYELGFKNICLTTSYDHSEIQKPYWISKIIGKDPPWEAQL